MAALLSSSVWLTLLTLGICAAALVCSCLPPSDPTPEDDAHS
jgi:hypothetical protein